MQESCLPCFQGIVMRQLHGRPKRLARHDLSATLLDSHELSSGMTCCHRCSQHSPEESRVSIHSGSTPLTQAPQRSGFRL